MLPFIFMFRKFVILYISNLCLLKVADWLDEVYAAINTLQERVLQAQNNVKRGLANIDAWGNIPLHNRRTNLDKLELLDINGRMPRFVARSGSLHISMITLF